MDSSAFHELTGAPIRGILPLDLSLSWQHKAAQTAVVLPLCNDGKRDRYLGCWYCVCCKPKQCSTSEEGRLKRSDSCLGASCLHRHYSFLVLCKSYFFSSGGGFWGSIDALGIRYSRPNRLTPGILFCLHQRRTVSSSTPKIRAASSTL